MKMLIINDYIQELPIMAIARYLKKYEPKKKFYIYCVIDYKKFKKVSLGAYRAMLPRQRTHHSDFLCLNDLGETYELQDSLISHDKAIKLYYPPNATYSKEFIEVIESMDQVEKRGATIVDIPNGKRFFFDYDGNLRIEDDIKWNVAREGFKEEDVR